MAMIAAMGYETASSDAMAREVFSAPETQRLLAQIAGNGRDDISPQELREAIGDSDEVRRRVNRVMHPRVRSLMQASSAQFHEVPLLIEACLQGHYEEIWVVTCGPEEQLRRLTNRLQDEKVARSFIGSQLSSEVKSAFADVIIRSEVPENEVQGRVRALLTDRQSKLGKPVVLP
jgi:dephospho-CoA kinase